MATADRPTALAGVGLLADAHERGVLRQVGAVYQFRHDLLQRKLAEGGGDGDRSSRSRS